MKYRTQTFLWLFAIQSALTGHLVFTTVHANNVVDVIGRFLNMNVEPYNFVSALNCVLAQRLVRLICPVCKRPVKVPPEQLPESGLDLPDADRRNQFPLIADLIEIAIFEKKPDQVLRWYDQRPERRFGWHGVDQDTIATAVQFHAPDRAVDLWKKKAEQLIARVKPSAYQDAAKYLRKAAKVMIREKKQIEWERYLKGLRAEHFRKRRLIEVLDGLDGKPTVKRRGRQT